MTVRHATDDPGLDEAERTEHLRQRHLADARRALPEHLARLDWPAERIRTAREARLRALVQVAVERSPSRASHP